MQEPDGEDGYLETASHLLGKRVDSIRDLSDLDYQNLRNRSIAGQYGVNRDFSVHPDGGRYMNTKVSWPVPSIGRRPASQSGKSAWVEFT